MRLHLLAEKHNFSSNNTFEMESKVFGTKQSPKLKITKAKITKSGTAPHFAMLNADFECFSKSAAIETLLLLS